MAQCSKCGGETNYKEGVSKKGNNYKGYKCTSCDNFDFIRDRQAPTTKPKTNGSDPKSYVMAYAKDVVVALINQGGANAIENPFKKVADGFKHLYKVYVDPYAKDEEEPF